MVRWLHRSRRPRLFGGSRESRLLDTASTLMMMEKETEKERERES